MSHSSTMSHDRVSFKIPGNRMNTTMHKVVMDTLGLRISRDNWQSGDDIRIVCRPSQFARFLIERDKAGERNGFKDLDPFLFVPRASDRVQDVSRNRNTLEVGTCSIEEAS